MSTPAAVPTVPDLDSGSSLAAASGWTEIGAQALDRLVALIGAGGPVVVVLLLLSTVAIAVILLKWWQFSRLQVESTQATDSALTEWRRHDGAAAARMLRGVRQPVAQLVLLALQGATRPGVSKADLREELTRVASRHLENLRAHLRTLEVIGTLSPLLGLLGTVIGMIDAFQQLETAGNRVDPALLSGGIWQALLTTALGLSVAIPVVLAHSWLERKVERCRHHMEDAVTQVFTRDLQQPELAPQAATPEGVAESAT